MKAYAIFPKLDLKQGDERSSHCIDLIVATVVEALRRDGDLFHYVLSWRDPGSLEATFHENLAEAHIEQLRDARALQTWVRKAVDPFDPEGGTVRSIATCRAATFGYDGQAFICLRHEDKAPTGDVELVTVEERPDLLTECDYFDGWVRDSVGSDNVGNPPLADHRNVRIGPSWTAQSGGAPSPGTRRSAG